MKKISIMLLILSFGSTVLAEHSWVLSCEVDGKKFSETLEVYKAEGPFASLRANLEMVSEDGAYEVSASAFHPLPGNEQTEFDDITIVAENKKTETTTISGDTRIATGRENNYFRTLEILSELPDGTWGPGVHVECELSKK